MSSCAQRSRSARAPELGGVAAAHLGAEAVADAVVRMHVGEAGAAVELLAQLAHEDVDGAIPVPVGHVPDALVQLVPTEHAAGVARELVQEAELGAREPRIGRDPFGSEQECAMLGRIDAQAGELQRLLALRRRRDARARGRAPAREP